MSYKLLSLLFLIYLSSTYCSDCSEKTTFEEGETGTNVCSSLSNRNPGGYICIYNSKSNRCEEITCESSPSIEYCYQIPDSAEGKQCLPKDEDDENSGCEYRGCEDLTSNCDRFYTGDDDKICTINSSRNKCEIKTCSSLTSESNCGKFIPYNSGLKCAFNRENNKCQITKKDCEEIDSHNCGTYRSDVDEGTKKCIPDSKSGKCKKSSCEELSKTECSNFTPDDREKVCAPDGEKCKVQSCPEISPDICETIPFQNPGSKCVKSGNSCTFSTCSSMDKSKCGDFIPVNKLYKCYYDEEYGRCNYDNKECSDFARGECDLFNTEDNLEDTDGKKCVESDGKCALSSKKSNSKMLEFPAFMSLIVLLLL